MEKAIQGFLVFLREEKKVSHNTEISYTRDLKHAKEFLQKNAGKELVNATGEDLEGYIAWVKENRSVATVSRRIVALRAFYK